MTLHYLIQKEFLQIRRNSFLPRLIILFPIVIMCVMPWVMSMEVKNIRVAVVDNDRTSQSQRLVHAVEASRYFIFTGQKPSYKAALAEVEKGQTDIVLEIQGGQCLIAANAVNGTKGAMGSAYLSQIVVSRVAPAAVLAQPSVLMLYNKHQNYKLYMIPALLAIVMMLLTGFLPTLNIVGEKEAGTIEQIKDTVENTLANIPGIICDGAKASCAAKIATSLDASMMAHYLAMEGKSYQAFTGILKGETDQTISTVGYIGKVGMHETDKEIIQTMLE